MTRSILILTAIALCSACSAAEPALFAGTESTPSDAIVLFDGKDISGWTHMDGRPASWKVQDGYMESAGGNLRTRREFGDCQVHVEFWLPLMASAQGQARANSGVYVQGSYEVQVLDSYGLASQANDCGAIYGVAAPMVNANRPPQQWQSYDIFFRAPRFDSNDGKVANARMTVMHNGVLIHESVEVPGPTTAAMERDLTKPGPIVLQDHGCPIRYRNIWVRSLGERKG